MPSYAIIGVSCLFPGATTPAEFWNNLLEGRDCRTEGKQELFGTSATGEATGEDKLHRIYCTRGGFVRNVPFTPTGYQLDADYLRGLDDVFKWPLHTAREALRDAGFPDGASHARTGLVMGNYAFPTPRSNMLHLPLWYTAVREGLRRAGIDAGPRLASEADPTKVFEAPFEHARVAGLPACVVGAGLGLRDVLAGRSAFASRSRIFWQARQ